MKTTMDAAHERRQQWMNHPRLDPALRRDIEAMADNPADIEEHFGSELSFGTGGMRGLVGPGLSRMNIHTVGRVTQGLANYLAKLPGRDRERRVAIAYDTRRFSEEFAEAAALVLAANGVKALVFDAPRPTPLLSFAVRELVCDAGIVITASHNPAQYNGYKVYGPDGGQAVGQLIDALIDEIERLDVFGDVKTQERGRAEAAGLFEHIGPELDSRYFESVQALSLSNPRAVVGLVYSPLHGTGAALIPGLLALRPYIMMAVVAGQAAPDPGFATVGVPNPEDPAAFEMALELARSLKADLVLATDPDADRVGTAVRGRSGDYTILTGNQVGALLTDYLCSRLRARAALPAVPTLVTTIVSGGLARRVAQSYGLRTVETLTGFKYIGEKIEQFNAEGSASFVFGYEESCGYLAGTFVRDKDAVIASALIAEMTAWHKESGRDLLQALDELQQRHGYFLEELLGIDLKNLTEAERYVGAYEHLPTEFAGSMIFEKRDYDRGIGWDYATRRKFRLDLPRSRVLHYTLADGSWFAVRPSGTEPKLKIYLGVCGATAARAQAALERLREAVLAIRN